MRKTAYKPFAVRLTPEVKSLENDHIAFVTVELVDAYGTVLPLAQDAVRLALEGPGEILAVGNGATAGMTSFADTSACRLYYGRGVVVLRRHRGSGKPLRLTASVPGLRAAELALPRR